MYSYILINFVTGHGRLRVEEVLDDTGRRQLERRLADAIAAGCTQLEIDCSRIRQLDLGAVRAIARARWELQRRGRSLTVSSPSEAFALAARFAGHTELLTSMHTSAPAVGPVGSDRAGGPG